MKKIIPGAMIISAALIIYSCSTPAYVEKDTSTNLSDYQTYMWVDLKASEDDASSRATSFADISVHNSVNEELQRWGWREVNENPDVLVSYDVVVERNVETQSDAVYSQPYSRLYYNRYTRRWSTIYYPSQFLGYESYEKVIREGTITVTMLDAKTDKTVWQGWTTAEVNNRNLTNKEIQRAVANIFKKAELAKR